MPIQVLMRSINSLFLVAVLALSIGAAGASAATPSVRVGDGAACALSEAGNVSCWGANVYNQLGDGTYKDSAVPVAVKNVSNAVQIDVGYYSACALIADGTVKCWGHASYGELGTGGPPGDSGGATTIAGLTGVTKISVGEGTICAIISSPAGTVKCWGYGSSGQLGIVAPPSSTADLKTPILGGPATDISVSDFHACAVVSGGVKCWGSNSYKQVADSATPKYDTPQVVPALTSGVALASAGNENSCAILLSGAIKCWGAGLSGQNGTGLFANNSTPTNTLITSGAVAMGYGYSHRCALIGDAARCWGQNNRGQVGDGTTDNQASPFTPPGLGAGVTSVDAGGENSCAIVSKLVKCWGDNSTGIIGNGPAGNQNAPVTVLGVSGATDVDVSEDHGCAISGGLLKCWGANSVGALGTGVDGEIATTPVAATTFGSGQTAVGVSRGTTCTVDSGAVKCAGYGFFGQLGNNTSGGSTPTAVSATILTTGVGKIEGGYEATCAIPTSGAENGKVYCWGVNGNSVLGHGAGQDYATLQSLDEPTAVVGIAGSATSVALNYTHACAAVSGALKCWGQNNGGSVSGAAPTSAQYPAIQTPGVSNVSTSLTDAVAVSYGSSCAIVTSPAGGIKCFGEGNNGTLGNGSFSSSFSEVDVTGISGATSLAGNLSAFCAVVSGAVKCWGRNEAGQLGNGTNVGSNVPVAVTGITDAVSVAGQGASFCALLSGGGVKCWGEGYYGQLGAGGAAYVTSPTDVLGLSLFNPPPPPAYVKQKIKPTLKLNGKVKKSGKKLISVPLKLYFAAPAGSNAATVCTGNTTISIKTSKKKTAKLKVKFKRKGANCTYSGKIKLPKSFKGKKKKFKISVPTNADVLAYKGTKTLKLK
jgi:alpha-tubulin suppressor-like RCC1 family protein